jgi:hypothetical protein
MMTRQDNKIQIYFSSDFGFNEFLGNKAHAANISYLASAAVVVFGVYLSAQAAFRLDSKSPAIGNFSYRRPLWAIKKHINKLLYGSSIF